jgi:thiol:disulfide interchange protein
MMIMSALRHFALSSLLAVLATACLAQTESAADLMQAAQKRARVEHKAVLVTFHASWCGWCKRLDGFYQDPSIRDLLEQNYVMVKLDVLENPDKKNLENPGAEELMTKWKGKDAGLPFMAILDANGKMLVNSNSSHDGTADNTGYPAKPNEVAWFMGMLQKTAPRLNAKQSAQMKTWLTTNAPKE